MSQHTGTAASDGAVSTRRDGAVLQLTLDRPDRRNSLTRTMSEQFVTALTRAATDDTLRAVHIRGAGADFCAGADWVAANATDGRPRAADLTRRVPHAANRIVELIQTIQLPVVCTVQGWAVGLGCNLALAADFTIAAQDAVFWEPFVGRGFSPDSGSTWLLPRLVGLARARRMLLLGEKVGAVDAMEWGMIHEAVAPSSLEDTAGALLRRLADGPTVAIGLAKQAVHHGQHASLQQSMTQELFNLELSCRTTDFKEGLAAFRERRDAEFRGR